MHGLQGDRFIWYNYANKYKAERKMNSYRPETSTKTGVNGSAISIDPYISNNTNNIVIAQSMGGLIMRQLHKNTNGTAFGGIITTGTPHLGAPVAASIDNGAFDNFINEMIGGPGSEGFRHATLSVIADGILSCTKALFKNSNFGSINDIFNHLGDKLKNMLTITFFGSEVTKNDLKPGSSAIISLQSYNPNIPKIAIYGTEDSPKFLRLAGSRLEDMIEQAIFGRPVPLGQASENKLINLVSEIANFCGDRRRVCTNWSRGWLNPLVPYYRDLASHWKVSEDYWRYTFATVGDKITSDYKTEYRTEQYQDYVCDYGPAVKRIDPDDCYWVTKTRTYAVQVMQPGDGVVSDFSAKALPGVKTECQIHAPSVNHDQYRNHKEMDIIFDRIFNGDIKDTRDRTFFVVNPR